MNNSISLSLFLPVYNEAAVLRRTVENARASLARLGVVDYEIIIVNDGSRDGSKEIAEVLAQQYVEVRIIHHSTNQGYGAALISGFKASGKDWVCYIDGDGQFNLDDLERFFPYTTDYQVILGYRLDRQDHWGRKLNAATWMVLVWIVLGLRVRDVDCAFKLIRREALEHIQPLESHGAVISAEIIVKLRRLGYRYVEVAVRHYPRKGGRASGARLAVIFRALKELFELKRRLRAFIAS